MKIASCGLNRRLHIFCLDEDANDGQGLLRHIVRLADGNWTPWMVMNSDSFQEISCAEVNGSVHISVLTKTGIVLHNILRAGETSDGQLQMTEQGYGALPFQPLAS